MKKFLKRFLAFILVILLAFAIFVFYVTKDSHLPEREGPNTAYDVSRLHYASIEKRYSETDEVELVKIVKDAIRDNKKISISGSKHSQ
jgi:hypothetical protein